MEDEHTPLTLPFITRDMLNFKEHASFDIRVVTRSRTAKTLILTGATREGIFTFAFAVIAGTTASTFGLPDIPIWISVGENTGDFENNEVYCKAYLRINGNRIYMLAAGYITAGGGLTWPQIHHESHLSGIGAPIRITLADPGATGFLSFDLARRTILKVDTVSFQYTTDVTVADRRLMLEFRIGGGFQFAGAVADQTQAASLSRRYIFQTGERPATELVDATDIYASLPENLYLVDGDRITAIAEVFDGGDEIDQMVINGREWINLGSVAAGE